MRQLDGDHRAGAPTLSGGMRKITLIAVHCSATMAGRPFTADDIRNMHTRPKPRGNGWSTIGYHSVIELDGRVVETLSHDRRPIHAKGHNANAMAVCYIGGIGANGKPANTMTPQQESSLVDLLRQWRRMYPSARIRGHRDLSPDRDGDGIIERHEWLKECPSFDVVALCHAYGIDPK